MITANEMKSKLEALTHDPDADQAMVSLCWKMLDRWRYPQALSHGYSDWSRRSALEAQWIAEYVEDAMHEAGWL